MKITAISDLHFGNPRMDPESTYKKLRKCFYPELRDSDLVIIAGDLYDQLLTVGCKSHKYASMFVSDLYNLSDTYGSLVRILHGTYTHDRNQLSVFEAFNRKNSNVKIINTIECEEITLRNNLFRIAYIPDNLTLNKSSDVLHTLDDATTLRGWSSIDILIGHGTFEHTIPPGSGHRPSCLFTEEQMSKIISPSGIVIMGHIHAPSKRNNIYYCGSFERLAFGEEHKKGFMTFHRQEMRTPWIGRFIENTDATEFTTITPQGPDTPSVIADFERLIKEKFTGNRGFVRVLHNSPEIRSILHKVTLQKFKFLSYSSKLLSEREFIDDIEVTEISLKILDGTVPNRNNLADLIYQYLEEQNSIEGIDKTVLQNKLQLVMGDE